MKQLCYDFNYMHFNAIKLCIFLSLLVKSKARLLFILNLFSYGIWKFNRIYRIDSFEQQQQEQQVNIKSCKQNQNQKKIITDEHLCLRILYASVFFGFSFYQNAYTYIAFIYINF